MRPIAIFLPVMCTVLLITACGGESDQESAPTGVDAAPDNTQEVLDYYASKPDFFSFKTVADLPDDLVWQDGMELAEIGSPKAKKGGTQYARLQDFPRTLRLVGPDSNGSFRPWILDDTTMQMGHRHPNEFVFYPGLASSWAVSKERKTVYVKLDPAARWSDGVPIKADDYLFLFFFFQSTYIVAPWYNNWYGTQYTNITKYDDHTISISVPEVKPDIDSRVLGLSPVPQHFYKELGDDYVERYQWKYVPTSGPYIVKQEDIRKGRSITLTRNDDWWAKDKKFWRYRYNTDKIHLSVIRDTPKVFESFKRGDIDQFGLNLAEYWYEKLPNEDADVQNGYIHKTVFYNQRPRPTYGLWINTSKPHLDNVDIRVGINYATNWQLVIDKFFRGDYVRMKTGADGFGEFTHPTLEARPFDIGKALEHFSNAGFTERGPNGILINEAGQTLSFTLSTGYEALKDVLTILKEEAAKAGLEYRIEVLDSTASWKKAQEKKHDIQLSAFSVFLEMYPRYWEHSHSDNAFDKAFLEDGSVNPERKLKTQTNNLETIAIRELDEMINRYRASDSKEAMLDLSHRMAELLYNHASFIPGYVQPFYRVGSWRWVRYPDNFNLKHSRSAGQYFVHWIDTEIKEKTLAARDSGQTFPPQINVFDQYRSD
ncbi:MAG: extracellular solute-binding protein [Pseudomonadales bacterium]|nr:extracellular solute-binding protein [Pseudomonadales bacterium]MDP7358430.1 extracellular solute-binding protein [Pseudomonadales bacterium]MDP7594886.1 extracellular solute-binding protein [Pseudomonadales bacterium]HJN50477.1 extracellular solute-binding protein [Pseudomonadales bacterium]